MTQASGGGAPEYHGGDLTSRNGPSQARLAQNLSQYVAALAPFHQHPFPVELPINVGVGVGVSSDEMPRRSQLTDLASIEEGAASDQAGGDKEVTPPPSPIELGCGPQRTLAAIVEGQQYVAARFHEIDVRHQPWRPARLGYAVQVITKKSNAQLECPSTIPLKSRLARVIGHVVVAQTRDQRAPGCVLQGAARTF
jgi:hypothetical protein